MELREAFTDDGELLFCETGNELAVRFRNSSTAAIRMAAVDPSPALLIEVSTALRELLLHCSLCVDCGED